MSRPKNIYIGDQDKNQKKDSISRSSLSIKSGSSAKYQKFVPDSYRQQSGAFSLFWDCLPDKNQKYFTIDSIQKSKVDQKQKKVFESVVPVAKATEHEHKNKYRKQSICFIKQEEKPDHSMISSARTTKERKLSFVYKGKHDVQNFLVPAPKKKQTFLGDSMKDALMENTFNFVINQVERKPTQSNSIPFSKTLSTSKTSSAHILLELSSKLQSQMNKTKLKLAQWITSIKNESLQLESLGLINKFSEKINNADQIFKDMNYALSTVKKETAILIQKLTVEYQNEKKLQKQINKQKIYRGTDQSQIFEQAEHHSPKSEKFDLKSHIISQKMQTPINIIKYESNSSLRKKGAQNYEKKKQQNQYGLFNANIDNVHQRSQSKQLSQASNSSFIQMLSSGHNTSSTFDLNAPTKPRTNPNVRLNSRAQKRNRSTISSSSIDNKIKGFEEAMKKIKNIITTN